ncbi:NAD(P)H-dependent oxidoreductase [Phaeovulum sp. NW3]|uniref:FMN-dependent NADH-azoreductase n=1 Tax=Phaeovulum sp. NW3 TaxID=2934933 RepID=UPI0020211A9D|nr:NAD(P)H-dependent oxidoreductase [Phaeovulum sp. NW3]MCL7463865.1 NAD(P)H-dependent oxidoreductase [Phaeovulum sp. NW3]
MTNILRIDASIKSEGSVSRRLTDRIIARLTAANPAASVTERDLSQGVPQIDGAWLGAVFTPADQRNADQAAIAAKADEYLNEVRAADILVIGLPVYNFGVPAQMKAWIDQLARKGETFTYTETGPVGLLTGKRAIIALSSDGTPFGSEIDFASGYMRHILGFFGITDVEFVAADKMVFAPEETLSRAEAAVDAIAA